MSSGPISEPARSGPRSRLLALSWVCLASLGTARGQQLPAPPAEPQGPVSVAQQKAVFKAIEDEVSDIFGKCKGAVVRIEATDPLERRGGTGFFIDPSGTIYTSYTVGGRSWTLTVEYADKKYPARTLLADPRSGVMILKIDVGGQTPFLPLGRSDDLRVYSPVVAIGYPMDAPAAPTFGLVAGFDQKCPGGYLPTTHVRANMPVRPGQAGAPLLNERGEVVGILAYHLDFGAVCLALPIQAAEKVRADYVRFGRVSPGWVGMTAVPSDGNVEHDPVKVVGLVPGAPAAAAGLQEGDVITKFGRTPIHHMTDLWDAAFFLTEFEKVPITVMRGDREVALELRTAQAPGSGPLPERPPPGLPNNDIENGGTRLALPTAPVSADQLRGDR